MALPAHWPRLPPDLQVVPVDLGCRRSSSLWLAQIGWPHSLARSGRPSTRKDCLVPSSTWVLIHAERRQLLEDLDGLPADQWSTPSLCPAWTVHQMLGHMIALTKQTPVRFFAKLAKSGFSFNTMVANDAAMESTGSPPQTLEEFKRHLTDTTSPPGPVDSWLGEMVVHGADIRRPLGLTYAPPVTTSVQVADFYKNSNLLIGSKKRIGGLRLVATDTTWTHGAGPEVHGPILSLVQAMTGRAEALADLSGDGAEQLCSRLSTI
jgi:uncharacterized protein (TIGR03083 family)